MSNENGVSSSDLDKLFQISSTVSFNCCHRESLLSFFVSRMKSLTDLMSSSVTSSGNNMILLISAKVFWQDLHIQICPARSAYFSCSGSRANVIKFSRCGQFITLLPFPTYLETFAYLHKHVQNICLHFGHWRYSEAF